MKTIVYLHGLNCSGIGFNHLINSLPEHNSVVIDYNSHYSMNDILEEVSKKLPNEKISLVGHSLGGLVGLMIAKDGQKDIDKVVTISSPIGGSRAAFLAQWLFPSIKSISDLTPTSVIIDEVKKPIKNKVLNIISTAGGISYFKPNDSIVTIESQDSYQTDHKKYIDVNHFEVLQHEDTVKYIDEFIFKKS
jgi:pimeloyl-ACP methyl ester carboxylesterase